jgi:hypothetical protein
VSRAGLIMTRAGPRGGPGKNWQEEEERKEEKEEEEDWLCVVEHFYLLLLLSSSSLQGPPRPCIDSSRATLSEV